MMLQILLHSLHSLYLPFESHLYTLQFQVFAGEELYPTIQAKGTRLGYGLIKNHCMLDGNKRIGTHAMLVFFALNGIELRYTQKELFEMVLAVADGTLEYEAMLRWVLEHQE